MGTNFSGMVYLASIKFSYFRIPTSEEKVKRKEKGEMPKKEEEEMGEEKITKKVDPTGIQTRQVQPLAI